MQVRRFSRPSWLPLVGTDGSGDGMNGTGWGKEVWC